MAKKKKKKDQISYEVPGPERYENYHVGQEVFCKSMSDGKLAYGSIYQIHLDTKEGIPCFTFVCSMRGSYQTSYFDDIIDNPTDKQKARRNKEILSIMSSLGGKPPRRSKKK
tara:strand:- start:121 stop:456 length:336 start_codon:yes stop_codon:yes gene_type:complete